MRIRDRHLARRFQDRNKNRTKKALRQFNKQLVRFETEQVVEDQIAAIQEQTEEERQYVEDYWFFEDQRMMRELEEEDQREAEQRAIAEAESDKWDYLDYIDDIDDHMEDRYDPHDHYPSPLDDLDFE